jgi:hypothetical protein
MVARRRWWIKDRTMKVVDPIREGVTFLCVEEGGVLKPMGTAFFVAVPVEETMQGVVYAVTARHNIYQARASGYSSLYVRLAVEGGDYIDEEVPLEKWDESAETDVAACLISVPDKRAFRWLSDENLRTKEDFEELEVSQGDDVLFMGLFSPHPGRRQMRPVARFGHVSLLPDEPVLVDTGSGDTARMDAYLCEARSWGGQSGSPAFFMFNPLRDPTKGLDFKADQNYLTFLGLVQGHYDLPGDIDIKGDLAELGEAKAKINAGMAIVIPAWKVREFIMDDSDLADTRKKGGKILSERAEQGKPAADSALGKKGESEFDGFEDLTEKVLQVPKEELEKERAKEERRKG